MKRCDTISVNKCFNFWATCDVRWKSVIIHIICVHGLSFKSLLCCHLKDSQNYLCPQWSVFVIKIRDFICFLLVSKIVIDMHIFTSSKCMFITMDTTRYIQNNHAQYLTQTLIVSVSFKIFFVLFKSMLYVFTSLKEVIFRCKDIQTCKHYTFWFLASCLTFFSFCFL